MKERILEAAERVFSEKGYYSTKVYQIAELAGVSVGTIYRFYNSKEELYAEVIRTKLKKLERKVNSAIKGKDPQEALREYVKTVIDFFEEERPFFELFMRETGSLVIPNEERLNLSDWYDRYMARLSKIIEDGIEKSIFKPLHPRATILAISGALKNLLYASVKEFVDLGPEEIKKTILEIVEKGILVS